MPHYNIDVKSACEGASYKSFGNWTLERGKVNAKHAIWGGRQGGEEELLEEGCLLASPRPYLPASLFLFSFSLAHLNADHFPAEDDFHATVLLAPSRSGVVGDRVGLAEPFGRDVIGR